MEYIIIEKNGVEYQIPYDEMELECDKYTTARKIINQNPTNKQDFLKAIMYAKADTSQKRLGCSYKSLSEKLQKIIK